MNDLDRKKLVKQINDVYKYTEYLNSCNKNVILFLELVELKDENDSKKIEEKLKRMEDIQNEMAGIIDKTVYLLQESSKNIQYNDILMKTPLFNKLTKIKNIIEEDGSTEA